MGPNRSPGEHGTTVAGFSQVQAGIRHHIVFDFALGGMTMRLPRAFTRLLIELAIVSLVQEEADLAQQVKGRWRGGSG